MLCQLGLWSRRLPIQLSNYFSKTSSRSCWGRHQVLPFLCILMNLYHFYIHHSMKMERKVRAGSPPLWQPTLLRGQRHSQGHPSPEPPQNTEGPGSPYNLGSLPSQVQSHQSGLTCRDTHQERMIELVAVTATGDVAQSPKCCSL